MKQLKCEMCGSAELLKQDGVFVCQSCGCKYSLEEAKKMIVEVEGTVEVQGTIRVDDTNKINNYLIMAESAYKSNNFGEAEKYCNSIIEIVPNNYKAWYLKGRAIGWGSTVANYRIEETAQCFINTINNLQNENSQGMITEIANEMVSISVAIIAIWGNFYAKHYGENNAESFIAAAKKIKNNTLKVLLLCKCDVANFNEQVTLKMNTAVCNAWKEMLRVYKEKGDHPDRYAFDFFKDNAIAAIGVLQFAIQAFGANKQATIQIYKNLIDITSIVAKSCSWKKVREYGVEYWTPEYRLTDESKKIHIANIMGYHRKIQELDSTYHIPEEPHIRDFSNKEHCYIATCVYGSYDCPQVWTLRRYRDDTLGATWYGRLFIRVYYAISPTLVKWFGKTKWFKRMWQGKLDKMVAKLNGNGVEDTPYQDKEW